MKPDYMTDAKMRCSYPNCEGEIGGGIVDAKMRPWHESCARSALADHPHSGRTFLTVLLTLMVAAAVALGLVGSWHGC